MIGVITAATNSGSVLGYDLGDKKDKDQRISILATEGVFVDARDIIKLNKNWTDQHSKKSFKRLSREVANDLAEQFDGQSSVNDRVQKTTGHIALSFSPKDRDKLKDVNFKIKIAREYMQRMGIVDTQWVLTEHFDTNAPHLHIAYNRVKFDGTVVDAKNERYRSQRISRELSEKYSLTPAGEAERNDKSLSKKRQRYAELRKLALEALALSCTMAEFKENLASLNISLKISKHSDDSIYGLAYRFEEITAKGSKLCRNKLSAKNVNVIFGENAKRKAEEEQRKQEEVRSKAEPAPAAEIVDEFVFNYDRYRVKKEPNGVYKIQRLEWDKSSPVDESGKYTRKVWRTKQECLGIKKIGRDANGVYFKIKDEDNKERFINQNGIEVSVKILQQRLKSGMRR